MTMANLASNLVETASGLGGSVALRVGPTATTYAELDRASSRVAGMLRERGLKPGDPVGIMLPKTSPVASFNHPDAQGRFDGHAGPRGADARRRRDGQEVPQGDVGEIVIRGHNVMKGYWHRPEDTAKATPDGWFRTGDMARVDEDGYYIVDRKKDMIIRGGYNVYNHVKAQVAAYKYPRKVWIVNELPKGPTAKIVKRKIVPPGDQGR